MVDEGLRNPAVQARAGSLLQAGLMHACRYMDLLLPAAGALVSC